MQHHRTRSWLTVFGMLSLAFVLAAFAFSIGMSTAYADEGSEPEPDADASSTDVSYSAVDLEVAAYYMADYGGSGDLPNAQSNVTGFYNTLRYHNYTWLGFPRWCQFSGHDCYLYGNGAVWEDDFVDNNNNYIDQNDIFFYEGHGWPGGFTVRAPDDEYVQHGEVQGEWGNVDLEWGFLLSCAVIADSSRGNWHGAMDGMHGLAGFRNTAYDVNGFGSKLATYIVFGYSFKDAWFKTCDTKQPSGVQAQIIVEENRYFNENAYNQMSDPGAKGGYWYWWKSCGAEAPGSVTAAQVNNVFPEVELKKLNLDEANALANDLTTKFGLNVGRDASATFVDIDGTRIITDADGRELEIDLETGLFYYFDQNRTFAEPAAGRSTQAILTEDDAQRIATDFLTQNGLLPANAVYNTVDSVVQGEVTGDTAAGRIAGTVAVTETTTGYQVIFNRYLSTTVVDAAGIEQTVPIPVDGPGAKIKVYVDPTAAGIAEVASNNQTGAVVGAMGGWRQEEQPQGRASVNIPLLDYETQILKLFESKELEPLASYESVPFPDADSKTVTTYTISGWEQPSGESQSTIWPAYRVSAIYTGTNTLADGTQETVVFTGSTWIAANERFMQPLAKFNTSPDLSKNYVSGDTISATAVDASKTLAELGYDSALTFVMGGDPDLSYSWHLGDAPTSENQVATGREMNYQLTDGDIGESKNGIVPLTFTLVVTKVGAGSADGSVASAQTSFKVNAVAPLYLPNLLSQ